MRKIVFCDHLTKYLSEITLLVLVLVSVYTSCLQAATPNLVEGIERTISILETTINNIEKNQGTASLKEKIKELEQKLQEKKEKYDDGAIIDMEEEKGDAEEVLREASNETFESAKDPYLELNIILQKLQNDSNIKALTKTAIDAKIKLNEGIQQYYNAIRGAGALGQGGLGSKILGELETYAKDKLTELAKNRIELQTIVNDLEEKMLEFANARTKERIDKITKGLITEGSEEAVPLEQQINALKEEINTAVKGDPKVTIERIRTSIGRLRLMIKYILNPNEIQTTTKEKLSGFAVEKD